MITITEALSEINLIKKKVAAKRTSINQLLIRATHVCDIYEKEGGARSYIAREVQSLADLNNRLIRLRAEISKANLQTTITLSEGDITITQSIHDWLIWKREIVNDLLTFLKGVNNNIKLHLDSIAKQPQVHKDDAGNIQLVKYEINVHYPEWVSAAANMSAILEKLDGQLSLKNATVFISE